MKIRCDLHLNGETRKLLLVPGPNESFDHLGLKLAAFLLFWKFGPIVDPSIKTPALASYEFLPDLIALDEGGTCVLWVECGTATMHKMTKLTRRLPHARIVVLKENERGALRLRADVNDEFKTQPDRSAKVEIWAWQGDAFKDWMRALTEKTEVYGESGELSINAVVNDHPVVADFKAY
jgi:hypothetical protein